MTGLVGRPGIALTHSGWWNKIGGLVTDVDLLMAAHAKN